MGAQPPHAGGPLPRGCASTGRTWGRGPPLAAGASDQAPHRSCRGPFAPRARGVEGSARTDRGEPQKKSCQRPRRGGRVQRPGASLGLDLGTPQRAGFCGGRSPARWAKRSGARPPGFGVGVQPMARQVRRRQSRRMAESHELRMGRQAQAKRSPGNRGGVRRRRTGPRNEGPKSRPSGIAHRLAVQATKGGGSSPEAQHHRPKAGMRSNPAMQAAPTWRSGRHRRIGCRWRHLAAGVHKKAANAASLCCGCKQRVYTVFAGAGVSGAGMASANSARACLIEVATRRSICSVKSR